MSYYASLSASVGPRHNYGDSAEDTLSSAALLLISLIESVVAISSLGSHVNEGIILVCQITRRVGNLYKIESADVGSVSPDVDKYCQKFSSVSNKVNLNLNCHILFMRNCVPSLNITYLSNNQTSNFHDFPFQFSKLEFGKFVRALSLKLCFSRELKCFDFSVQTK